MQIVVTTGGSVRCVYDELLDLSSLGKVCIERGSHVEPNKEGKWIADLGPVSGPRLGPFERRSQALEAEREWLDRNWLENNYPETIAGDGSEARSALDHS